MKENKTWTVYRHTSPSGKCYIGITCKKPEWRWNHGKGYKECDQLLFYRAIKKYGWDNITHEILYSNLTEQDAKNIEIRLIKQYKSLGLSYNITDGGDGHRGSFLKKRGPLSEETKRKMSESRTGMFAGSNNPMYGRHETASAYGKFGSDHPASKTVYQYSLEGDFIKEWTCLSDVQRELGIIVTNITACCNGRNKTAKGYIWRRYKVDKLDPDDLAKSFRKNRKKTVK